MKPTMIWANLASENLEKTISFYTDLGFMPNGTFTKEGASFIFAENDFVINFFTKSRMEEAMKGTVVDARTQNEVIFSMSADTREEVEEWFEKVRNIGGTTFSEPEDYDKGYTFGFSDPDGHKFNILYWPEM
ncbi:MAG: glyoxalase [Flavobacterium sp.]|nr:MAG: glyoxalase [Flavobacterium sp.]